MALIPGYNLYTENTEVKYAWYLKTRRKNSFVPSHAKSDFINNRIVSIEGRCSSENVKEENGKRV